MTTFDMQSLGALFRPRSVAVIGASADSNKVGGRPLAFLRQAGFRGRVYPVNPGASEVQGLPAYRSVGDIDGPVDHAIVAVPRDHVAAAIEQCASKGVRAVQVFTSGFSEAGEPGRTMQQELAGIARRAAIRMIGPNSLGLFNVPEGFFGTFATHLDGSWPTPGNISFASQSGGFGSLCYALARVRGLGFSHFITTGNEADVDVAECIAYLADEPSTQVIVATFEGCRDGRRLIAALERARSSRKPVILMKLGATEAGARAVETHTGSLAGEDAIYDAVFRQYGAHRARSLDELVDAAYTASRGCLPKSSRLATISLSGGIGVLTADASTTHALEMPPLDEATMASIRAVFPYAAGRNPLDTSGAWVNDPSLYARVVEKVIEATQCDIVFGYLAAVGRNPKHWQALKTPLFELRKRHPDKLFVMSVACTDEVREELEGEGFLWFAQPDRAVAAAATMANFAKGFQTPATERLSAGRMDFPVSPINEVRAKEIIAQAGIRVLPERLVDSPDAACAAAAEIGYPVVVKVVSPDIAHKTDIGGVKLDLRNETELRTAFNDILRAVKEAKPEARLDGMLVSPMVKGGVETVLGVVRDATFGPVVMFGLGGAHVEVFRDVSFRVAPFDVDTAREMIAQTVASRLLKGVRGAKPADVESLARMLAGLSQFAYANSDAIKSIDINPYVAAPEGGYALDALVVPN